ncbi:MAG: hypothetical protein HPY85_11995 [Anaerolineae bacterium]|jgi:hypothetical protein|nr:hypothetical protein [Anaerolineae bacterium]
MKYKSELRWLIPLIGLLALIAALMGLLYETPGAPYAYTNHRGEEVMINGHGLYSYDTVSSAAQMQGNDLVTLTVGLPLLAVSTLLAFRGSLRGRLLLTGTLGFFLYTYMSMAMLAAYNNLFLVYVAAFSLSLFAFILCMLSFDLKSLPAQFSSRLPRVWISTFTFIVAGFLLLAWLGQLVPPLVQNQTPPMENTTTRVIQAMDLGMVVPLALLAGIHLLRKNPWGYLLASLSLTKGVTLGLGVSAMAINMARAGVPDSLGIMIPFLAITIINLVLTVILLKNVSTTRPKPAS